MPDEVSYFPAGNLLQILSAALARVAGSYDEFSSRLPPDSAKDYIAHHNACKAALAHLGAVIKLHDLWRKNERKTVPDSNEDIESLLRQARHVLLVHKMDTKENNDD